MEHPDATSGPMDYDRGDAVPFNTSKSSVFLDFPAVVDDKSDDPLTEMFSRRQELSTNDKMLHVLDEVETIYETFLTLISAQPAFASDPAISSLLTNSKTLVIPSTSEETGVKEDDAAAMIDFEKAVVEIMQLLTERQADFNTLIDDAKREAEVEVAIRSLTAESEKLKEQVMTLQGRLKEAEQILSNALHLTKQKTETVKAAADTQLNLDEIVRYAHRISVGYSVAAPANWMPGDPRRPYPTDLEMRAGVLARVNSIPAPPNQIPDMPTDNLTSVMQKYVGNNAGPYVLSPLPLSQATSQADASKSAQNAGNSNLHRETSSEEPDVETMSSESSSTSSSEEE